MKLRKVSVIFSFTLILILMISIISSFSLTGMAVSVDRDGWNVKTLEEQKVSQINVSTNVSEEINLNSTKEIEEAIEKDNSLNVVIDNKDLEVSLNDEGVVEIDDGTKVQTDETLKFEENKLSIETDDGNEIVINIFPSEAFKKSIVSGEVNSESQVDLKVSEGTPYYSTEIIQNKRFLGIIPYKKTVQVNINAQTGKELEVDFSGERKSFAGFFRELFGRGEEGVVEENTFITRVQSEEGEVLLASELNKFSILDISKTSNEALQKSFHYDIIPNFSRTDEPPEFVKEILNIDIPSGQISAISVSGMASIRDKGWARVIAVDSYGNEWLIFGSDFLFEYQYLEIDNFCEETCLMDSPININYIFVELLEADLFVNNIYFELENNKREDISTSALREAQHETKIRLVNNFDDDKTWNSGETTVSHKTYSDIKKLQYEQSTMRIPYNFLFYKGGVYKP